MTFFHFNRIIFFLKTYRGWIFAFIILTLLGINATVSGHAHVWIKGKVNIRFNEDGVAGFKCEWELDDMFSSMLIHDHDKNRNKKFEQKELKALYEGAFINLENSEYFTYVEIDGESFKVESVENFNAEIIGDLVVYHFFIPCPVKADNKFKEIRIAVYDETIYTSIKILKDQVKLVNNLKYECIYEMKKNKEKTYYYGQVYPEEIVLRFRKKNE